MTKIAFVYYSMYGHMKQLIDSAAKGIKETYPDVEVKIFAAYVSLIVSFSMHRPSIFFQA
jgi:multimeric flavodoxin WrbA